MNFNCNMNCCPCIKSKVSTVTVAAAAVELTPDTALAPQNYGHVCILVTSSAGNASALPVTILLNGIQVPMYDRVGNVITGQTLPTRKILKLRYGITGPGAVPQHVIVTNIPSVNQMY